MVNFARLVEHVLDVVHQGHNFFQILCTFLMIVEPSDAQNPLFLSFLFGRYKNTPKGCPRGAGAPCSGNYFDDVEIILKRTIS